MEGKQQLQPFIMTYNNSKNYGKETIFPYFEVYISVHIEPIYPIV